VSNRSDREIAEREKTIEEVCLAAPRRGGTVTLKNGRVVPAWEVEFIRNIIEVRLNAAA
jgi:hypothetical protein